MIEYRGYLIATNIVCFNVKYQVYGEGFGMYSPAYDSLNEARKAIDNYLTQMKINFRKEIMI